MCYLYFIPLTNSFLVESFIEVQFLIKHFVTSNFDYPWNWVKMVCITINMVIFLTFILTCKFWIPIMAYDIKSKHSTSSVKFSCTNKFNNLSFLGPTNFFNLWVLNPFESFVLIYEEFRRSRWEKKLLLQSIKMIAWIFLENLFQIYHIQ